MRIAIVDPCYDRRRLVHSGVVNVSPDKSIRDICARSKARTDSNGFDQGFRVFNDLIARVNGSYWKHRYSAFRKKFRS